MLTKSYHASSAALAVPGALLAAVMCAAMPAVHAASSAGDTRIAVVAIVPNTGGNGMAQSVVNAADGAIAGWPGYSAISVREAASALNGINVHGQLDAKDYQAIGQRTGAPQVLTVMALPSPVTDTAAGAGNTGATAVAELFDSKTGGLIGRGTAEARTDASVTGTPAQLTQAAVNGAVSLAVSAIHQPALFEGVVVSRPDGYLARLSRGSMDGLRNGARVEYQVNGATIAYGTVVELGQVDAVATVAPESATSAVIINGAFRTVSNPTAARAGLSLAQLDDKAWRRFEREFTVATVIALVGYRIYRHHSQ